jgi:hypothetical protein
MPNTNSWVRNCRKFSPQTTRICFLRQLALTFVAIKKSYSWTSSTREISIAAKIRAVSYQKITITYVITVENF